MPTIVFYLSGHGFGHASRQIEIINALTSRRPDLDVRIRSAASRWLFERTLNRDVPVLDEPCDTGIVQIDSLHLDEVASIQRAAAFYENIEARAAREAAWLRASNATLVIADTPPLACLAARLADLPSFVVGNFTWDWIYAAYDQHLGSMAPDLVPALSSAYATAEGAWRLPMWGGFETIDSIVDVPFVARHARHTTADVRRTFGLPVDRPLVLISFGGYGLDALALDTLDVGDCILVTSSSNDDALAAAGRGGSIRSVDESRLYDLGYRYEDLVAAVDVVLTKPGYGIISECIANDTAILYTSRGRFAEYGRLVDAMPQWLACEFIGHDDLFAGRWAAYLQRVLAKAPPAQRPRTDGADVVVDLLLDRL